MMILMIYSKRIVYHIVIDYYVFYSYRIIVVNQKRKFFSQPRRWSGTRRGARSARSPRLSVLGSPFLTRTYTNDRLSILLGLQDAVTRDTALDLVKLDPFEGLSPLGSWLI